MHNYVRLNILSTHETLHFNINTNLSANGCALFVLRLSELNMAAKTFLFTSESVGEGHPGMVYGRVMYDYGMV